MWSLSSSFIVPLATTSIIETSTSHPHPEAGIDLLGRGFTVWEPFIDVSSVLLGLLELCCDPALYAASMATSLPITPAADSCRSAHHALSLIATARPATFITTMAQEVAKQQAQATQAQTPMVNVQITTLYKAKAEILRIVELLIEKMQNDVVDLIVEATDILVFCLDSGRLRTRGLMDVFPAVCRFNMLSYCHNTKKIAVGAKNGSITIYDLKTNKSQTIPGHSTAVTALGYSADGKYLASYAFGDTKLFFWQEVSTVPPGIRGCHIYTPSLGSVNSNTWHQGVPCIRHHYEVPIVLTGIRECHIYYPSLGGASSTIWHQGPHIYPSLGDWLFSSWGLMNSATKCVKCYQTKPFTGSSTANELRQVSLSWPQPRAVILRNVDKTLDKFSI
ncbi:putative WD repeat-containing protein 7 isoform X1 [Apostichopus japonicus]|uniref:Putative WD repeat-containing protein 7 isoform X1 n=1 Tax=Stichopus japonicus TaxID=307972 RepID=A0A2G8LPH7_STIJA|nr:putative WD repeat-containing protein 7 isoform X1 [Apostichopus japonicus]